MRTERCVGDTVTVNIQLEMTAGEILGSLVVGIQVIAYLWFQVRRPEDEVLLAWQLRSRPIMRAGEQVKSGRFWDTNVENPYRFELTVVNVGNRDIDIEEQFPVLSSYGTKLFSIELVGPESTVFVRVEADRLQLNGGGGDNPNRWETEPFHLAIGQALTVEGVTSGRAKSATFHNMRHARYLRRARWWEWSLSTLVLLGIFVGSAFIASQDGFSGLTVLVGGLVSLLGILILKQRWFFPYRRRSWWVGMWPYPPVAIPEDIPRPPTEVTLLLKVETSDYGPTGKVLMIENGGLDTAVDVTARVLSSPDGNTPELEEAGGHDIEYGNALGLAFLSWPDSASELRVEVQWSEGTDRRTHIEILHAPPESVV